LSELKSREIWMKSRIVNLEIVSFLRMEG